MSTPTTTAYLDYSGVAARLGVTVPTVRRLRKEQGLPAHCVARRVKFLADEVDAWLRTQSGDETFIACRGAEDHRSAIKRLVDGAPEITGEQAERIKAVLVGAA